MRSGPRLHDSLNNPTSKDVASGLLNLHLEQEEMNTYSVSFQVLSCFLNIPCITTKVVKFAQLAQNKRTEKLNDGYSCR